MMLLNHVISPLGHIRAMHKDSGELSCLVCSKSSLQYDQFSLCMSKHGKAKRFQCESCPSNFARLTKLKTHVTKKHGTGGVMEDSTPIMENIIGLYKLFDAEYKARCKNGCGARYQSHLLLGIHEERFCDNRVISEDS